MQKRHVSTNCEVELGWRLQAYRLAPGAISAAHLLVACMPGRLELGFATTVFRRNQINLSTLSDSSPDRAPKLDIDSALVVAADMRCSP